LEPEEQSGTPRLTMLEQTYRERAFEDQAVGEQSHGEQAPRGRYQ